MNMIDFFFTKEFAPKRGRKLYKKHKHDTENKIFRGLRRKDYLIMRIPYDATIGLTIYHDRNRITRVKFASKCVCSLNCKYLFIHEAFWTEFCKCGYSKRDSSSSFRSWSRG